MSKIFEKYETGSTNDDAKYLAEQGAETFTTVWAHRQTAGRGSHDRSWTSIEGNVLWSVILRPDKYWHAHTDIVYVKALSVYDTVKSHLDNNAALTVKWPNDLLLNGKKVAGTLTEASGPYSLGQPTWIVTGTGINVVGHPENTSTIYDATSLHAEGFISVTRDILIKELIQNLRYNIDRWKEKGFEPVRERYLQVTHGLGTIIRVGTVSDRSKYIEGRYIDITSTGSIVVEDASGTKKEIFSGEVIRNQ